MRALLACSVLVAGSGLSAQTSYREAQELLPSVGAPGSSLGACYGREMAVTGGELLVGAPCASISKVNDGAVFVYGRTADGWQETRVLHPAGLSHNAGFGTSLSAAGGTLVVGAYQDVVEGQSAGSVFVYERDGGGWQQTTKIVSPQQAFGIHYGVHVGVAPSQQVFAVGADGVPEGAFPAGAVYVYERSGDGWLETAELRRSQPPTLFGRAVDVSDARIVVGSPGAGGGAYVFEKVGGAWQEIVFLPPPSGAKLFGISVSIVGDRLVVGASEGGGLSFGGSAFVYERVGEEWLETARLFALDATNRNWFGHALTLSPDGSTVLVGAQLDRTTGIDAGALYVFRLAGGSWYATEKLFGSDTLMGDQFGVPATDGETIFVGGEGHEHLGAKTGGVWVFDRPSVLAPWPTKGAPGTATP